MRIALIGYGKMGKRLQALSEERGHVISFIVRAHNSEETKFINRSNTDVAIDFSIPTAAYENIMVLLRNNIPVVSGTTGWGNKLEEILEYVKENNQSFFYAPNFSYSLFMFDQVQAQLARLMNAFPKYNVQIEEIHHTEKKDSPSGTAIRLANTLLSQLDRKSSWVNELSDSPSELSIISKRQADVPGTHLINYYSQMDEITLTHTAKDRDVFVIGAIDAASFLVNKNGCFGMSDLITSRLNSSEHE